MSIQIPRDASDRFRMQAVNSLAVCHGVEKDPEIIREVKRHGGPIDIHGVIRQCLLNEGVPATTVSNMQADSLYNAATRMMNAVGTSDLPAILEDTLNKSFALTPAEAGATFDQVCAEAYANDFKQMTFPNLSQFGGGVDEIPEGGCFKQGSFSDSKEYGNVVTKGKAVILTRQAILNNETGVLFSVPRRLSAATYATMNRDFYNLLMSNPVMNEDGKTLFHKDHGNVVTDSGSVSVQSIDLAEQALSSTELLKANPADQPDFIFGGVRTLLAGTSQRVTTLQTVKSTHDAAASNGITFNPFTNSIKMAFDPYLQSKLTAAGIPNAFFCMADNFSFPNATVIYLSGNKTPIVRSGDYQYSLGLTYTVHFDYGFTFQNWRGIIKLDGVAAS